MSGAGLVLAYVVVAILDQERDTLAIEVLVPSSCRETIPGETYIT